MRWIPKIGSIEFTGASDPPTIRQNGIEDVAKPVGEPDPFLTDPSDKKPSKPSAWKHCSVIQRICS